MTTIDRTKLNHFLELEMASLKIDTLVRMKCISAHRTACWQECQ